MGGDRTKKASSDRSLHEHPVEEKVPSAPQASGEARGGVHAQDKLLLRWLFTCKLPVEIVLLPCAVTAPLGRCVRQRKSKQGGSQRNCHPRRPAQRPQDTYSRKSLPRTIWRSWAPKPPKHSKCKGNDAHFHTQLRRESLTSRWKVQDFDGCEHVGTPNASEPRRQEPLDKSQKRFLKQIGTPLFSPGHVPAILQLHAGARTALLEGVSFSRGISFVSSARCWDKAIALARRCRARFRLWASGTATYDSSQEALRNVNGFKEWCIPKTGLL